MDKGASPSTPCLMESHSGFTPVRRRETVRQDISPVNSGQIPWTKARCYRLLRPLSSRIELFRKQKRAYLKQCNISYRDNSSQSLDSSCQITDGSFALSSTYQGNREALEKGDDPDWAPENRPRKRLKRTYSSKSSSQNSEQAVTDSLIARPRPTEVKIRIPLAQLQDQSHNPSNQRTVQKNVHPNLSQEVDCHDKGVISTKAVSQGRKRLNSIRESFRNMAKSTAPSEWILINGLYNGLDALLKATARSKDPTNVGARSLFATCIRKVPERMFEEQKMAEDADPDYDDDAGSFIYEDLESYGSSETGGWIPLREVARAHGINYLVKAIEDGWIKPSVARGLVIICLGASAFDEAQQLIDGLIRTMRPLSRPRSLSESLFNFHGRLCPYTLNDFSHRSGHHGFLYRQLAQLFSTGLIPIEWIASHDMAECWNQVIGHIVQDDNHARDAECLLRTAVAVAHSGPCTSINDEIHAYRLRMHAVQNSELHKTRLDQSLLPYSSSTDKSRDTTLDRTFRTAVTNTLTNLLTVLLSINLASDVSCLKGISVGCIGPTLLQTLALEANHSYQMSRCSVNENLDVGDRTARLSVPIFAYGILKMMLKAGKSGDTTLDMGWLEILSNLHGQASTVNSLSSFICALAHCCDQAAPMDGFEHLQEIVGYLLNLSKSRERSTSARRYIHRIAIDAAFEFAEGTKKRKHLDWVLELEESIEGDYSQSALQTPGRTPSKPSSKRAPGFRWEEGICEWVARTPAVIVTKLNKSDDLAKVKLFGAEEPEIQPEHEMAADKHVRLPSSHTDGSRREGALDGNPSHSRGGPRKTSGVNTVNDAMEDTTHNPPASLSSDKEAHIRSNDRMSPNPFKVLSVFGDDADELSASESSQELPPRGLVELRDGKAAHFRTSRSTGRYEKKKSAKRRSCPVPTRWSWGGGRDSESDDELGT